ncbi:hypothetical protein [Pseudomonas sp. PCH199]|uniref:hypothetical protein n=1 Tax=unclassified Pseudomonas TaxID=196821 RepID=UPI0026A3B8E5|nr:hypothetical protein [Pseudomonas sp. PCH199]
MSVLKLRRVDAQAHARAQVVRHWQRAGYCAGLGRPTRQPGYLRFCGRGDAGDWQG